MIWINEEIKYNFNKLFYAKSCVLMKGTLLRLFISKRDVCNLIPRAVLNYSRGDINDWSPEGVRDCCLDRHSRSHHVVVGDQVSR